ncbi:transcription initiation factor TFIID subunit 8 [Podospora fimiseda]|uniref:Transcription initiation factor TFIID subunit 8 n=1 Tax=Podospora fimiseda TaxID=252190 RepID=A0AAN7GV12_9PEZI|nr:transcription initiation factor TFIID subunit 8 [Podospora fimiseda]
MPTPTLTPDSRKRSIEAEEDLSQSKKQRTESPSPQPVATILAIEKLGSSPFASTLPTFDAIGKQGLRRSIALVLDSIGFDTARPEALESFVVMAENYLASLVEEVKASANKARRNQPIPRDFEVAFRRFNITTSSLMPHKKKKKLPVSRSAIIPTFEALSLSDSVDADLPILGADLDGTSNKQSKLYIPSSFPTFPSIHTYKYSPEAAENFTISDNWGEFEPDLPSEIVAGSQPQSRRPLAAEEIPYGDPKKLREAAAKEAKAGEAALRGLVRASKIARQKEVWASAQRNPSRRSRQIAWEAAMRDLLEEDTKAKGGEVAPAAMHGEQARMEIADHSMIVNTERRYYRQEVPRKSQGVANRA